MKWELIKNYMNSIILSAFFKTAGELNSRVNAKCKQQNSPNNIFTNLLL